VRQAEERSHFLRQFPSLFNIKILPKNMSNTASLVGINAATATHGWID
jgi:hypothetical protein